MIVIFALDILKYTNRYLFFSNLIFNYLKYCFIYQIKCYYIVLFFIFKLYSMIPVLIFIDVISTRKLYDSCIARVIILV